jgi:ABC-type phosphate transport system substrate-binding protein
MKIKKPLILGVVASIALTTFAAVTPAFADPVSNSYVLVGSDTLQDSTNAIVNGTLVTGSSVQAVANGSTLGSFDAFGSANIQTKSAGPYFYRPAGSGDGRNALISSITGAAWHGTVITGQVDIARSSSGAGANASDTGDLAYVPYGRDAVGYAYNGPAADLGNLSTAQLKAIYESNTPIVIGGTTVKPLIPQSSSGTRSFFLGAIGVTTLGTTVSSTYNTVDNTLPENNGGVLTSVGQIVPFSAASWVAQANGAAPSTLTANAAMGAVNGTAAFTGSGSALIPNSAFYSTSYGRDTYLIVEFARINPADPKYDVNLANLVDRTLPTSLTNFSNSATTVGAVKKKFGFLAPSSTTVVRAYPAVY